MRHISLIVLIALCVTPAFPSHECEADLNALRALYAVREAMISSTSDYAMKSAIEEQIDMLREPLPEGGFRWIEYVRPAGDGPVVKREHLISAVQGSGDPDIFESTADHPFAVRVVVPRKRSIRRANKELHVGTLVVRYWVDGRPYEIEKQIDQWFSPDTSKTFDLGVIADRAEASLEAATKRENAKDALVEIHFRQAVARDDPDNPNFALIETLKRMSSDDRLTPAAVDYEIARLEKRLFPELDAIPLTAVVVKLREANVLLRSEKPDEQEKGRKILADIVRLTE